MEKLPERAWLGVVSAAHVRIGVRHGFAQVQHGKRSGLDRLRRGDGFVHCSPTEEMGGRVPLRAFTALGVVVDDESFQAEQVMAPGSSFRPFRRLVDDEPVQPLALEEVRDRLALTASANWGYRLRRGLVPLDPQDFALLAGLVLGAVPA
ncbi:EVE domain-containing protein [Kineococcus sp. GCM10028916]|uniref:EVE domain-containing protein n=1 Tax=Kineococcus sp. GCM10028916 TaxID=3273394 RepID=UPI00363AD27F